MAETTELNAYDIEKQVYQTQWTNIRHHWNQTFSGITHLSTLIALAVVPLKFVLVEQPGTVRVGIDPSVALYLKVFVGAIILLLALVTFLNQLNHYRRSQEARRVVVAIEKAWGLYDKKGRFVFQDNPTKYDYAKLGM